MNKKEQLKHWKKLFKEQMQVHCPLPKDFTEKLAFYKIIYGNKYKRLIYKANIKEFSQPTTHYPYGWLALYDDFTEKDLSFFFRLYKRQRIITLRNQGIKIRKHITHNIIRDYEWAKIVKNNKKILDYKKFAQEWARENMSQIKEMLLQYLWQSPRRCISIALENLLREGKKKKQKFEIFVIKNSANLTEKFLNADIEDYIEFQLPRLIRSAIVRYKKKPH